MSTESKGFFLILILLLLGILFFFFGFGINTVYIGTHFLHLKLDRAQFWTVAILISIALYLVILIINRKWKSSLGIYILINLIIDGIVLVMFFLVKNPYLKKLILAAFGFKF